MSKLEKRKSLLELKNEYEDENRTNKMYDELDGIAHCAFNGNYESAMKRYFFLPYSNREIEDYFEELIDANKIGLIREWMILGNYMRKFRSEPQNQGAER